MLPAQMSSSAKSKLQSLILPGLGELNMGHEKRARSFFIREAAIWLIYIVGKQASNWYESDYRAFAELHADINMDGKDYIFAVNMGNFNNFSEYNDTRKLQRQVNKIYKERQGNEWQWDSDQNRKKFENMLIQSVSYDKYASFAIGGLILHRLISLIDVIYLERQYPDLNLTPQLSTDKGNLQFNIQIDL